MSVSVAGIDFERHHYDQRGDVLYLNTDRHDGNKPPFRALATPEGHNVEYDDEGHVTSLVLVNVRWLLERDGEIRITWPAGHVSPDELAAALAPVA
jgi:hypothetical protein